MDMVLDKLGIGGIIPVVTIEDPNDAEPLAKALLDGGMTSVEVTLRTPAALEAVKLMAKYKPSLELGVGTVLSVDHVKAAVDAGATYIVSPGLNRSVVEYCIHQRIPVLPGIATPTEAGTVLEYGLKVAKFFPAESNGGVPFLRAMGTPFKDLKFVPTGGIDETNLLSYLRLPQVLACGGSWMVKPELLREKKFDEIRTLSEKAVGLMLGFDLRHIGVNCESAEAAQKASSVISKMLRFPQRETPGSIFVGTQFELMKTPSLGKHGHIALSTNFIARAISYLERNGVKIKPETRSEKDGKLSTVYLDLDLAGFAVHLVQV
jgi:2-dehydro-3-deoxyphosphogluconate aldolase/(4S)-4-hydroxy-2-oxoglutarate aldolase